MSEASVLGFSAPPAMAEPAAPLPVWIAHDPASLQLLDLARKLASTASNVLMLGESGTGKDALAQWLHFVGPRRHQPFVKIDCASLPAELVESELFGYEKGAFTGAYQAKPGRLETAGDGTLVLDEVAALSLPLQAKLLRVLEEKTFERLGGHQTIRIHARLLALTNVDLEQAVARRTFREDLYYRLFVVPLEVPPLRRRRDDILPLATYFADSMAATRGRSPEFAPSLRQALLDYSYPGNVRELRNLISRALIVGHGAELTVQDFPPHFSALPSSPANRTLDQVEKEHIAAVLHHCQGRKQQAAAMLGISPKTLLEKRRKYGLDLPWTERVPTAARGRDPHPARVMAPAGEID